MRNFISLLMAFLMLNLSVAQVVSVGNGIKDDTNLPVAPYFKYSYSQCIYLASEINKSGNIYRIKYKGKAGLSITNTNEWTVYVGHTSQDAFTPNNWIAVSDMTQVFSGTVSVVNDDVEVVFTAPFNYNGTDNLVIAVDENQDGYDGSGDKFLATDVEGGRSLLYRSDSVNPDPASPPESILQSAVANIDFDFNETACNAPTAFTASNATTTSIDLSWTAGSSETSWTLEYGQVGFAQGSGTTINSTTNSQTISGLTPSTAYQVYIKSNCPNTNGESAWSGPHLFRTICTVSNTPVLEGFENGYVHDENIEGCITQESVKGSTKWKANNTFTNYFRTPRTGNWNAFLPYNNEAWMFIPVSLTAGKSYTAEVYARQNHTNGAWVTVSYGSTNTAAGMTNEIVAETGVVRGDYQKISGNFTPTTTGTYYIGVKGRLSAAPYYLSIDDIRVRETPACMEPGFLKVSNIGANSVDLEWTAGGSETAWVVEYGPKGFIQGSGTTVNANSNPFNLTGLNPDTEYDFYVKADCGGTNGQSEWSNPFTFKTACTPFAIPYFEGFENGYTHDALVGGCLSQESVAGFDSWIINNTHTNYNRTPRTGNWNAYLKYSNEDWLFIPLQLTGGTSYTVDLYARQNTPSGAKISISYGNMNNATSMTNSIVVDKDIVNGDYQKVLGNFTPTTTGVYYIGIKAKLTNKPYYLSIDDIRVRETPSCLEPGNLTVSDISDVSANLSWTAGGSETAWIIEYGTEGFTQGSGTTVNATTNPFNLTGLTANTKYNVYIKADCGGTNGQSDWEGPFSFTTACTPYSIPYFEGFETGYTHNNQVGGCLSQESVAGLSNWTANNVLTSYNRAPRTGSWNAYLVYATTKWMFIPVKLTAGKTYMAELYARQDANAGAKITISYGESRNAAGMTNTIVAETDVVGGDYQKLTGTFTPANSGTYYVGIKGEVGNTPYYMSIDDFKITEAPACSSPKDLTVTNISANSADLGWTAVGNETAWIIEYGAKGFTQGSGTTINATTNPYNLTGLTANTEYDFYVKADCEPNDWVGPFTFKTSCQAFAVPYFEGFESGYTHNNAIEGCLSQESISGNSLWRANNLYTNYNRAPRTGNWNAYLSYNNQDWLFIPIQLTEGTSYTIDLYARQNSDTGSKISVSYGNSNTAEGMTNEIVAETEISNGDYQKVVGSFTPTATGTYYIGIKGQLTGTTSFYLSIDDIRVRETPSCLEPNKLKAENVSDTSADLGWTAGGSETAWVIEYGAKGFTQGSGTSVNVTTNPYSLTGLTANTEYDFYVKADCGGTNGQSDWSSPYTFKTTCASFTVPYFEGFETGYAHNAYIEGCFVQESAHGTSRWRANNTHVSYNRAPRTGDWNAYLAYDNTTWMFIPVQLTQGKSYATELYARQDASSGAKITISYGQSATIAGMTNAIVAETDITSGDYQKLSGTFTPATTGVYYVGIKGEVSTIPYFLSIDDFNITEVEACTAPTALTATNITATSADLGWTAGGSETAWIIEYGAKGFTQGSGTTVNANTNPHNLTGLTASTEYDFYVKADCSANQSEWVGPFTFKTACQAFAIPYFQGFETGFTHGSDIEEACLSQESVGGSDKWKANNTLTSYNRAPRTGEWNAFLKYGNEDWLFIPVELTAGTSYTIDLYARQDNTSGANMSISYGDTNTAASMTNEIVANTEIVNGDYQKLIGSFTPTETKVYYVGIKGKATITTPYYLSIDDIRIRETPTCLEPESLTVNNITTNSAELAWTAVNNETAWVVEYGVSGFELGSGTSANATTNPYSITGLSPNTKYDFYVKADCGGTNGQSEWSGPYTFNTACAPYSVPYFEGFENGYTHIRDLEGCITQENVSGTVKWKANNTLTNYNRAPRTGEWNAFLRYISSTWMFVAVELTEGKSYTAELYARQDASSGAKITISYGNKAEAASMTNAIVAETDIIDGDYQKLSGNFTPATSGVYYVGIKGDLNNTPFYLSIDDFKITESATCMAPTALTATNITDTTVDLGWTAGGSETAWIVEYGAKGFTQGSGTTVNVTTNPYSLTGLSPNTEYDFYVKADCGTTDGQSEWSQVFTFSTSCSTYTITHTENFDDVTVPALPNCWSKIKENDNSSYADILTTSDKSASSPNSVMIRNGNLTDGVFYLISPKFSDLNNEKKITFKAYKDIGSDADGDIVELGVMTDASDTNTYTTVHTFSLSDFEEDAWKDIEVKFTDYTGGAGHVVIKLKPGTAAFNTWYFDNFIYDKILSTNEVGAESTLAYYPNPVKDYLHINAESIIENVKIFNSNGQLVLDKNTNSATIKVNTSKLSPGVYIVRATLDDKEKVFKILKK